MSARYACGQRRPITLAGKHYRRGERLDARAVEGLKGTVRRALLERGEIVFLLDDELLAPDAAASRVNVRTR